VGGIAVCGKFGRRLQRGELTVEWYDPQLDPTHPKGPSAPRTEKQEGGTPLEQYAKSTHGQQLYSLHDNGFSLAETQREMTDAQRIVYLTAKGYWTNKQRNESRSSMPKAGRTPQL
jgi:hypothetical protein